MTHGRRARTDWLAAFLPMRMILWSAMAMFAMRLNARPTLSLRLIIDTSHVCTLCVRFVAANEAAVPACFQKKP